MNWDTVQATIQDWVQDASGYADGQVIWSQQKGPRPSNPWISLRVLDIRQIGLDWMDVIDVVSPDPGEEIDNRIRGTREMTLSVQVFGDIGIGSSSPLAVLENVRTKALMQLEAFKEAGIGLLESGPVQSIDGVYGSNSFEPRAICDFRFSLANEISNLTTYIETVQIENEDTGGTFEVP